MKIVISNQKRGDGLSVTTKTQNATYKTYEELSKYVLGFNKTLLEFLKLSDGVYYSDKKHEFTILKNLSLPKYNPKWISITSNGGTVPVISNTGQTTPVFSLQDDVNLKDYSWSSNRRCTSQEQLVINGVETQVTIEWVVEIYYKWNQENQTNNYLICLPERWLQTGLRFISYQPRTDVLIIDKDINDLDENQRRVIMNTCATNFNNGTVKSEVSLTLSYLIDKNVEEGKLKKLPKKERYDFNQPLLLFAIQLGE